jgi:hypothetical protein
MTVMKLINKPITSVVALASLLASTPALAGGPLANCAPGVSYAWINDGQNIPFNADQGDLGPVPGPAAVAFVAAAFQEWGNIPSSTLSYVDAGPLPVDVDVTNYGPYLNAPAPDGLSAVVFDDDGSIFIDLGFGGSGVLGFAGPEWGNAATCEITESLSFLNGPAFTNPTAAFDVMVHEFGHWTNFAHTVVNGQVYLGSVGGDNTGPTPFDTFGAAPNPFVEDVIETMYPFYYGPGIGTGSLEADDIAIASRMYPQPDYTATTGEISGTIYLGTTRVTGANIIARNVADPFHDAVSAISSDFTDSTSQADPNVGVYRITGLTPGAEYGVFVDTVLAGGFSTALSNPLPGPEELYNGANESDNPNIDDPSQYTPITVAAGSPNTGIDIIFNQPQEGDPLPVGDDGSVRLGLPFAYEICGQEYNSVFVNANGNLTFGVGDSDFSESAQEMLDGPPRIAGVWDDLNPSAGGSVYYTTTNNTFTVTYDDVPEWFATGSNTFSIELKQGSSQATVDYGDVQVVDGLAGVSCGLAQTGGVEPATELNDSPNRTTHNFNGDTALYEQFGFANTNDLANYSVPDVFEPNNSLGAAAAITPPLNTAPNSLFTEISPSAADIDFFSFEGEAGQYAIVETTRGQIDSVLGVFVGGVLIAANDDKGTGDNPLLSRIEGILPVTGTYTVAVTFCCDYDFDGVDPGQGAPFDEGRYVLDLQVLDYIPLELGDDDFAEIPLGFSFPYQGASYSSVYVNSNGSLTFGSGDTDFSESVSEFLAETPRIAALWDDLSPNQGGMVFFSLDPGATTVTFQDVPEFALGNSNNFSVTMYDTGEIDIQYGNVDATDGIAGVTEGGGAADPGETDLSSAGSLPASGTTYEQFTGDNDLDGEFLDFNP